MISQALSSYLDVEAIIFKIKTVTFRGSLQTPNELITCEIQVPPQFRPTMKVDSLDKLLHFDFADPEGTYNSLEFEKFVDQTMQFGKCQLGSLLKFSNKRARIHLNINPQWNTGFYAENVNLLNQQNGDFNVEFSVDEFTNKRQFLFVILEFDKSTPKEEIDLLVEYLKNINGNVPRKYNA
jgi:hypothetical protein